MIRATVEHDGTKFVVEIVRRENGKPNIRKISLAPMDEERRKRLVTALKLNRSKYEKGKGDAYWNSVVDVCERFLQGDSAF